MFPNDLESNNIRKTLERDRAIIIHTIYKKRIIEAIKLKQISDDKWIICFNLLTGDWHTETYRTISIPKLIIRFADKWLKIFEEGDGTKH